MSVYDCLWEKLLSVKEVSVWVRSASLRLWGKLLSVKEVFVWVRSVSLRLFVGEVAVSERGF